MGDLSGRRIKYYIMQLPFSCDSWCLWLESNTPAFGGVLHYFMYLSSSYFL